MIEALAQAGLCACGCGQPTSLGKVQTVAKGRTRADIAAETGLEVSHVTQILLYPPRYINAHKPGPNQAARLRAQAKFAERKAPRLRDVARHYEKAKRYRKGNRARIAEHKSQALAKELRAFDLRVLAFRVEKPRDDSAARLVKTLRREISPTIRDYRGRTDPTIEWLREQVGIGWKRDATYDPRLVSLDGMDLRADARRSGDAKWWEDKNQLNPAELFERQVEQSVAEQMVASGDPLVARAVAFPESLTVAEREQLSEVFALMERTELAGGVPTILPPSNIDRGGGLSHGLGSKKTSHQKVAHAQIKKAMGRSGHPEQKPRQKYRRVLMDKSVSAPPFQVAGGGP